MGTEERVSLGELVSGQLQIVADNGGCMTNVFLFMMGTLTTVSKRAKGTGIVLIVMVGLLNFHVPHFLLESPKYFGSASSLLELVLLATLLGAVVAAVGIYRNMPWGWLLGILIASISFVLYLAQETVGLPGLPKMWWEPSRIVSLIVEGLFVVLARYQVVNSRRKRSDHQI